jgi:hypothetical protein
MNRFHSESNQISGFLQPRVSFRGRVDTQARSTGHTSLADIPTGARGTGSQEASEIGHVAAAQEQAAAVCRVADELRESSNDLGFDFDRNGGQFQVPTFAFTTAASKSASIPIGVALDVM